MRHILETLVTAAAVLGILAGAGLAVRGMIEMHRGDR